MTDKRQHRLLETHFSVERLKTGARTIGWYNVKRHAMANSLPGWDKTRNIQGLCTINKLEVFMRYSTVTNARINVTLRVSMFIKGC